MANVARKPKHNPLYQMPSLYLQTEGKKLLENSLNLVWTLSFPNTIYTAWKYEEVMDLCLLNSLIIYT